MTLPRWRKARASSGSNTCVELDHTKLMVRDSKNPTGPVLVFGPGAVDMLIEFVKRDR